MSWGTCYAGSNNIHPGFPPIMSDGRNFANWLPGAAINNKIRENAGIKTNKEYRQYLQTNAKEIIQTNQLQACDYCCACPPVFGNNQPIPKTPYLYKSSMSSTQPYGYENSDLKKIYLSGKQLETRLHTPYLTQQHLLPYPNFN